MNINQIVLDMKTSNPVFDASEFIRVGNEMLAIVAKNYQSAYRFERPIIPDIQPGSVRKQFSQHPPEDGISEDTLLEDTNEIIFPSSSLWCHPNFFAYYPQSISHAAVIAEIYANAFQSVGSSAMQIDIENLVCDWIVQAFALPKHFLLKHHGGGVIHESVSYAVFLCAHAAKRLKMKQMGITERDERILRLVAYQSENVHSSTPKALFLKDIAYIRNVPVKMDPLIGNFQVDISAFRAMVQKDVSDGLIPFWYGSTWGTTATCAYDQVDEIADVCAEFGLWLNLDAAYAGSSWVIPEYRKKVKGLEKIDSLQINLTKFMMTGYGSTVTFVKDKCQFNELMTVPAQSTSGIKKKMDDLIDLTEWQVSPIRRFNALKLWWVMRYFGVEGIQENLLGKIELAKYFESLVLAETRWRIFTKRELVLVTFYLHNDDLSIQNTNNQNLLAAINKETTLGYISGVSAQGVFFLRFVLSTQGTNKTYIDRFWQHINNLADHIVQLGIPPKEIM